MAKPSTMETLIELSEKASEAHAKQLGIALQGVANADKKMALLRDYRAQYVLQLGDAMQSGMSSMMHGNYRMFMQKLDEAILSQAREVQYAELILTKMRAAWQLSEKKRMSYDILDQREKRQAQNNEAKRDQKSSDEQAARLSMAKK